ncbi:hypothetical protein ACOSOMT5_P3024 [Acidiphilium sp. MT5]
MTGSTINTTMTTTVTLGSGSYSSPLTITNNGAIVPSAYGADGLYLSASLPGAFSVINAGIIGSGIGSPGISSASNGLPGSPGSNGGVGAVLMGQGVLTNQIGARIIGGEGGAGGYGGSGNATAGGGGGTGGSGGAGGSGVDILGANTLTNNGSITGGHGGNAGSAGSAGELTAQYNNLTTVETGSSGGGGGPGGRGGAGVYLAGTGSLTNSGVIVGGDGGNGSAGAAGGITTTTKPPGPGGDGGAGGNGADGGAGVAIVGSDSLVNLGSISGGSGGNAAASDGGGSGTAGQGKNGAVGYAGSGGDGILILATSFTTTIAGIVTGGSGGAGASGALTAGGYYNGSNGGAGGTGVDLAEGGTVTIAGNVTGGTGGIGGAGGLSAYSQAGQGGVGGTGVNVASAASAAVLINEASATITGGAGASGALVSAANSSSPGGGVGGYGVSLNGGTLDNQGVINGGAGGTAPDGYFGSAGFRFGAGGGRGGAGGFLDGGQISNDGTIQGGNGGGASPGTSGVGSDGSGGTGGQGGSGASGLNLTGAGAWSNDAKGVVIGGTGGAAGAGGAPSGAGLIGAGGAGGVGGAGVFLEEAGTFSNAGTVRGGTGGSGPAASYASAGGGGQGGTGISLYSDSTVRNTGGIAGGMGGAGQYSVGGIGGAGGAGGNGGFISGSSTLINDGVIHGGGGGLGGGADNGGEGGFGGYGGSGVLLEGNAILINTSLITGGNAGTAGASANGSEGGRAGGVGVYLTGGTLINAGTIEGGYGSGGSNDAIEFGAIGSGIETGTLVFDPGASFIGKVVANASVADVFELASATAYGTLTGLGSQFTNFQRVSVQSGARWDLSGANQIVSGQTVSQDGILVDTGNLYIAGNLISNAGTVGNALIFGSSAAAVTLSPTASIIGSVVANPTVMDALYLSSGNGAGTLAGLGTQFADFQQISVDRDSTWSLTGISTILAGTTMSQNGSLIAVGSLMNAGTISASGYPITGQNNAIGVVIASNSVIENEGIILGGGGYGTVAGGAGVYLNSSATLMSAGMIGGGSGAPGNTAAGGVAVSALLGGDITNSGTLLGGDGGSNTSAIGATGGDGGMGAEISDAANLLNTGLIDGGNGGNGGFAQGSIVGDGGKGGIGVDVSGSATLTDNGTIVGGSGGTGGNGVKFEASDAGNGGGGGVGVYLNGGVLINSGAIIGGDGGLGGLGSGTGTNGLNGSVGAAVEFGSLPGTLIVNAGASFVGAVIANSTVSDILEFASSATANQVVEIGSQFTGFRDLSFATNATWSIGGTYTAFDSGQVITGFAPGDTLVLDGFAANTSDVTYINGVGLELTNGTNVITLDIAGNFTTSDFIIADPPASTTISLVQPLPCFAAGTRILAVAGEVAVEHLREGDRLILNGGDTAAIKWIGRRALDIRRHPNPDTVMPILFEAGALGDGIPCRPLYLSPDHALYLDNHLIPAKTLINGLSIRQIERATVVYYHLELEHHAVILAEGAACETYLDTGNRAAFENGADEILLHPDFSNILREQYGCAPFATTGAIVENVRRKLLARAGIQYGSDPHIKITYRQDGSAVIESRSAIPGYISVDPSDRRSLGVKIASIKRADGVIIPLNDPNLREGWHDPEPDGRWTNGCALIPQNLIENQEIHITIAATIPYPIGKRSGRVPASTLRAWGRPTVLVAGKF